MSRVQAVVEAIARALVEDATSVVVTERPHKGGALVELELSESDFGRVIGRQGKTAMAIRTLANTAAELEGKRVQVEFRERPPGPHASPVE